MSVRLTRFRPRRFSVNIYEILAAFSFNSGARAQCSAVRLAVSAEFVHHWLTYARWWQKLRKKKVKFREAIDIAGLDIG